MVEGDAGVGRDRLKGMLKGEGSVEGDAGVGRDRLKGTLEWGNDSLLLLPLSEK